MNIFNIPEQYASFCVCGDIHGEFKTLAYNLKQQKIENAVIVVAGDCGIGFEKAVHYSLIYEKISKTLKERNIFLLLMRGNHDDPDYFSNGKIDFPLMKTLPDYSVLRFSDKYFLCIGGAISIDRKYRQEKMWLDKSKGRTIRPLYWENETAIFNGDALDEISKNGIKIDCVISHTCPSFCFPVSKSSIECWLSEDPELDSDLILERATMDKIYTRLVDDGHPLKNWVYAHFHGSNTESINGTNFSMLNIVEIKEIRTLHLII